MPLTTSPVVQPPEHQPTLLETQLDSIYLRLGNMKAQIQKAQILQHMTPSERAAVVAALARTEDRLSGLMAAVSGS